MSDEKKTTVSTVEPEQVMDAKTFEEWAEERRLRVLRRFTVALATDDSQIDTAAARVARHVNEGLAVRVERYRAALQAIAANDGHIGIGDGVYETGYYDGVNAMGAIALEALAAEDARCPQCGAEHDCGASHE